MACNHIQEQKRNRIAIWAFILLLTSSYASAAQPQIPIVIGAGASEAEKFAAEELATHFQHLYPEMSTPIRLTRRRLFANCRQPPGWQSTTSNSPTRTLPMATNIIEPRLQHYLRCIPRSTAWWRSFAPEKRIGTISKWRIFRSNGKHRSL